MNVTLAPGAKMPQRGTPFSAGLDLYALQDTIVTTKPTIVPTGVSMEIPTGYAGFIWSRSSMAVKGVYTEAGLIDSDYRSQIGVVMFCSQHLETYKINAGDKIAQIVIAPVSTINPVVVESLSTTVRGMGGFGSTGKT